MFYLSLNKVEKKNYSKLKLVVFSLSLDFIDEDDGNINFKIIKYEVKVISVEKIVKFVVDFFESLSFDFFDEELKFKKVK